MNQFIIRCWSSRLQCRPRRSPATLEEPAAGSGEPIRIGVVATLEDPFAELLPLQHRRCAVVALQVADIVTVMQDGSVLFTGTPDEIRHNRQIHDMYLAVHHG
ncbi:MAG: hypothetical protein HC914_15235 [Chloroflexaceae bacterium]|nr:hypothetical protein [Chloroflexaceae bacterium]